MASGFYTVVIYRIFYVICVIRINYFHIFDIEFYRNKKHIGSSCKLSEDMV